MSQEKTVSLIRKIFRIIDVSTLLCWLSCLSMAFALYAVFLYAPTDKTMGVVQRIFYFHVAVAWVAFLAFFIVMVASLGYLCSKKRWWDTLAHAAAEIGILFCTLVLITGMLWAKPVWNTWWAWDLRLTTALVLWLMYVAYLMLRTYTEGERGAKYAAVFGMIAFIDVPVVYFSIRWWRTLHPAPVIAGTTGSRLAPEMLITLVVCLITFMCLFFYLLQQRVILVWMENELEKIRRAIANLDVENGFLVENQNFVIEEYNFEEYRKS